MPENPLMEMPQDWALYRVCELYHCTPNEARKIDWEEALTHLSLKAIHDEEMARKRSKR